MPPKVTKNMKSDEGDSPAPTAADSTAGSSSNGLTTNPNAVGQDMAKLNENESFQLACAVICLDGFPNKMKVDMQKFADLAGYKGPSVSSTIITRLKKTLHAFQADLTSGKTVAPHKTGNRKRSGTTPSKRSAKKPKIESDVVDNPSDNDSVVDMSPPKKTKASGAKRGPKTSRAQAKAAKNEDVPSSSEENVVDNESKANKKKKKTPAPKKAPKKQAAKVKSEDDVSMGEEENFTIATKGSSNETDDRKQPVSTMAVKSETSD